jgi:hypothetical protein
MENNERIILSANHRRSLSSSLVSVEQSLIELRQMMTVKHETCCFDVNSDIGREKTEQNLKVIEDARKQICKLSEKYNTDKKIQSLQRVIDVKKARIWEILCDSKAKKLKGFGAFPHKQIAEYDKDIDELLDITGKLTF